MLEITPIVEEGGGSLIARLDGKVVGHIDFTVLDDSRIDLNHTEVDVEFGGRGFGRELVKAAAEYALAHELKLRASCPFARKVLDHHPEYRRLLG